MVDDEGLHFARLTLTGDRFNGARLPVDALVEIQRYRVMLLEAAKHAWLVAEGHEQTLPDTFVAEFDLAISGINDGSATPLLDKPTSQYDVYYLQGRDSLEADLAQIMQIHFDSPDRPSIDDALHQLVDEVVPSKDISAWTSLTALQEFRDFGTSLRPDETMRFPPTAGNANLEISSQTALTVFQPFAALVQEVINPSPSQIKAEKYVSTVAGRLFAMNADKRNFDIETLHYGNVHGNYTDAGMTADLKAVLESRSQAPVVRVTGRMSWRDGSLYRILGVDSLELLEIDTEPWSSRVRELATLPPNWHPEFDESAVISFVSIDAAREIMRAVSDLPPRAGIYPREDGGVVVEWPTSQRLLSLEITPDASLYLFNLDLSIGEVIEINTVDVAEISHALREALQ